MPSILGKSTRILLARILSTLAFSSASAEPASPAFGEVNRDEIERQFSSAVLDASNPLPSAMNGHTSYGRHECKTLKAADKSMGLRNSATGRSAVKRSRSSDVVSKVSEYMVNNGQVVTIR